MPAGPPPRRQQIATILVMAAMLVGILLFRDKCGSGTANLFKAMDQPVAPSPK